MKEPRIHASRTPSALSSLSKASVKPGKRRDPLKIVDAILEFLKDGEMHTVSEIASSCGLNYRSAVRYVDIAKRIQDAGRLMLVKAGHHVYVQLEPWSAIIKKRRGRSV